MVGARATSNGFIRMRPGEGARERTKREGRERVREGRTLGLSLLLEQGGRGGAHARARGSHTACSSCVQSDDGAAPEAFNIDKKSTESPNFSPLYLLFRAIADQTSLLRVVELYAVNNFA